MCAILDNSACSRVFGGESRPDAGKGFFEWINNGKERLVIGGRLRQELYGNSKFREWAASATQYGFLKDFDDDAVGECESGLRGLVSNDSHVIALAIQSNARLLCTDDRKLMSDFKNEDLIRNPKGSIYFLPDGSKFDKKKRILLQNSNCEM